MMQVKGLFLESWDTKWGHGIKVRTDKAEAKFFGRGERPSLIAGSPVSFEATQGRDAKSWNYSNLHVSEQAEAPRTNGAARSSSSQGRDIFITGVVGRAMGSGKFGINDLKGLTFEAANAWDTMTSGGKNVESRVTWGNREELNDPIDDIGRDALPF